jgi:predicted nucleic acid-binding protein
VTASEDRPHASTALVLDASIVVKWIRPRGEQRVAEARALRVAYRRGAYSAAVPALFYLEMINIAARRWRWSPMRLDRLVAWLNALAFTTDEPPLQRITYWANRGLTAYDACYLALAELRRAVLVTADEALLEVGGRWVRPL